MSSWKGFSMFIATRFSHIYQRPRLEVRLHMSIGVGVAVGVARLWGGVRTYIPMGVMFFRYSLQPKTSGVLPVTKEVNFLTIQAMMNFTMR